MNKSMKDRLSQEGVLASIAVSGAADALLTALEIQTSVRPAPDREEGDVKLGFAEKPLGVFDLNLRPPDPVRRYVLTFNGPAGARTGFRLAVSLNEGPQQPLFTLAQGLPGYVLKPATPKSSQDAEWLEETAGEVRLAGATVALVLKGTAGGAVAVSLSPNLDPPDDVVVLTLQPAAVLLGGTGFGFEMPSGVVIDDSEDHAPPGPTEIDGVGIVTPADTPSWRGIAIRTAKFYLPQGVPFLGGHAVGAHLQIGRSPAPGIDLLVEAKVPPKNGRPGIDMRIECRDPTATGIGSFLPTLVEAVMTLPLDGRTESFAGQSITFAAGTPVRVRARYARAPVPPGAAPVASLSLAVESQGPAGLLRISSDTGELGAKIAVTAATLATALIADGKVGKTKGPDGDGSGVILHALLTGAVGLSSFLHSGEVILHGAEIVTEGGVLPAGKALRLRIDYSVAATVTGIDVGVLSVQMKPNQPLRVRVREVVLAIDPDQPFLDMFHLDYSRSTMEVEDPGGWMVQGPGSLFDVLGTRSGRGSMWIEVDLRFKIDLGPVKVTGATIRATLDAHGKPAGQLRGLAATIDLDPMIDGSGAVHLDPNGFRAMLAAHIRPLDGLAARADVEVAGEMVKLALGVDLPGPIPLANTGLGIYGLGGVFAANGRPAPQPPGANPVQYLLDWDYRAGGSFVPAPAFSVGLEAVLGTAPDLGFTFSARTGLFVTTPDIVVRGAVNGRFMGERVRITRDDSPPGQDTIPPGVQARGVIVVDPAEGVTIALEGSYTIPRILEIIVPVAARFPKTSGATTARDWYIHLGADGWTPPTGGTSEGREMGPVRATVFPGILDQGADAYLMFRGNGITEWPRGGHDAVSIGPGSFVAAFGFGFDIVIGSKPIVWAEVFARADILLATNPMTLVGLGKVGGRLHVGVFSVGVDASLHVYVVEHAKPYLLAEVCGEVDLLFDKIRKCVKIAINNEPEPEIPKPPHPLDIPEGQALVDDKYRVVERLAASRQAAMAMRAVWPDAIPLFAFGSAPKLTLASTQFVAINVYPQGERARPLGNDLLQYEWELTDLVLVDATDANQDKVVAGTYSGAWLDGKFGDAGGQPQPAELALLTPHGDLWFDALADAGSSLPHQPVDARADICNRRREPRPGWAVGVGATSSGAGYRLPPDPSSADPTQSQVRATAALAFLSTPFSPPFALDVWSAQLLPPPYDFAAPLLVPFASPRQLGDRAFSGFLDVGSALPLPGSRDVLGGRTGAQHQVQIDIDEPLHRACAWLVVNRSDWPGIQQAASKLIASDDLAQMWTVAEQIDVDGDRVALLVSAPAANPIRAMRIRFPVGFRLGIIAVGGITATADAAAAAHNKASLEEAALLAKAKANGPPKPGAPPSSATRCVLKPNKVYRIDITMRWSAVLSRYENGKKVEIKKVAADAATTETRSYWYRTAKLWDPANAMVQMPHVGTFELFSFKNRRYDVFEPSMLERHLRGHEPAQSELHRFAEDPVRVYFGVDHVGILASAYDFDLMCGLRRLDAPVEEEPDQELPFEFFSASSTTFMIGGEITRTQKYLESACALPTPGAVLQAPVKLTRETWYEVFALAKPKPQVQNIAPGRLPGVTFRTSRWGTAAEMLAALRFAGALAGSAHGDVAIPAAAPLVPSAVEDDDAAFDALLDVLGIDGWPTATEPRVSLLWREAAPRWRCAGVLVESPEPIHRPGRCEVRGLRLRMRAAGAGFTFDIRRRDRSGSRLLFATSAPFVPVTGPVGFFGVPRPPLVQLELEDIPIGQARKTITGLLQVPLTPSFAEEAV